MGAVAEAHLSMTQAAQALAGAKVPLTPGPGDFLQAWAGVIDPPTVGQNLLGQQDFTKAVGSLPPGGAVLMIMTRGVGSHRGTDWQASGVFNRLLVVQGDIRWQPTAERYQMVKKLALADAPEMKEISLFALPPEIDLDDPSVSDAMRRFYRDSKRLSNARAKAELTRKLSPPDKVLVSRAASACQVSITSSSSSPLLRRANW